MDPFERLIELVPPPAAPVRGDGDWDEFGIRNGFEAPADYRRLIRAYGVGEFGVSLIRLLEPFHPSQSFVEASEWDRQNVEGQRRQFPEFSPYWPIWPQAGGFLPWASTGDGNLVGWGTAGAPDQWNTLCWGDGSTAYPMGILAFLVTACEGGIDWIDEPMSPIFEPYPEAPPSAVSVAREVTVKFRATPRLRSFEAVLAGLAGHGIAVVAYGDVMDDHQACSLTISFPAEREDGAKAAVVEVARGLGGPVIEVRDLRHRRIWPDI